MVNLELFTLGFHPSAYMCITKHYGIVTIYSLYYDYNSFTVTLLISS
jgi:hypothetical protein